MPKKFVVPTDRSLACPVFVQQEEAGCAMGRSIYSNKTTAYTIRMKKGKGKKWKEVWHGSGDFTVALVCFNDYFRDEPPSPGERLRLYMHETVGIFDSIRSRSHLIEELRSREQNG